MKELRVNVEINDVDVPPSVRNARGSWRQRTSALVRLENERGCLGYGEATPLPGYSPDTLEQASSALRAIDAKRVTGACFAPDAGAAVLELGRLCGQRTPSAAFALQGAALTLRAAQLDTTLGAQLHDAATGFGITTQGAENKPRRNEIEPAIPAELLDPDLDWAPQLEAARSRRATCFKLKLGIALDQELERLGELREMLRPEERLRLDANASLDADTTLERLAEFTPEYVEEPLQNLGAPRALPIPLALDESLWRRPELARSWLDARRVHTLVLKPMALGLVDALAWADTARRCGTRIVVSHCFDGALAAQLYAALAEVVAPGDAMGLGPHPGLELWQQEKATWQGQFR